MAVQLEYQHQLLMGAGYIPDLPSLSWKGEATAVVKAKQKEQQEWNNLLEQGKSARAALEKHVAGLEAELKRLKADADANPKLASYFQVNYKPLMATAEGRE